MSLTRDQATEKIRKLLQKNGRTEAEADTAQILAAALADKHGIDIATVSLEEDKARHVLTYEMIGSWAITPPEAMYAGQICQIFFDVTVLVSYPVIGCEALNFIGTKSHIQIAQYVFTFLVGEFRRRWNSRRGRCKARKQFLYGMYFALRNKLAQRTAQDLPVDLPGLMISERARRAKYIQDTFGETTEGSVAPKGRTGTAATRGYWAGKDIEIRDGIQAGDNRTPANLTGTTSRLQIGLPTA